MSIEANKLLFRSIPEKVFNTRRLELIEEYFADDFVDHSLPPGFPEGRDGVRQFLNELFTGFPDHKATVTHILGDGDENVAGRLHCTGTHLGTFMGIPATGRAITWTESHFGRIADGKLAEHWGDIDMMGMMQQLGAIPSEEQPANNPATA